MTPQKKEYDKVVEEGRKIYNLCLSAIKELWSITEEDLWEESRKRDKVDIRRAVVYLVYRHTQGTPSQIWRSCGEHKDRSTFYYTLHGVEAILLDPSFRNIYESLKNRIHEDVYRNR